MPDMARFFAVAAFALSLLASVGVAFTITNYLEARSLTEVSAAMAESDNRWVSVRASGLSVILSGEAPDEATRFNAISEASKVISADRIIDNLTVAKPAELEAPRYSMELLRNGDGVSLIGLIPAATGRESVLSSIEDIAAGTQVTDMLETADHPVPDGWNEALRFAIDSLRTLPRSKLSMSAGRVEITAISDSVEEKAAIEKRLRANKPDGVTLILHISAPRPVIAPFTLRFIRDETGARFDACSADSPASRDRILSAGKKAGVEGRLECAIGLGAPSHRWAEAVERSLRAVTELGGGTLTFSDTDISLIAPIDTAQSDFDRIVGAMESDLPDIFTVHAVLPPKIVEDGTGTQQEAAEFTVVRSPEGLVQMRGRLPDERSKLAVASYAKALFGSENVHDTSRVDPNLPDGWPVRVLAGLQAMGHLHNGSLVIHESDLSISGRGGDSDVSEAVSRILAEKLGAGSDFTMDVAYEPSLDPSTLLPSPEECEQKINDVLKNQQITFAPSSANIEAAALGTIDRIAQIMEDCSDVKMEIGGYTDSQGRETMNLTLSQARAEAVLDALLSRDVLTSNLTAKGYGEENPIADNETEEGRQANRRIEFRLIIEDAANDAQGSGDDSADGGEAAAATDNQGADASGETTEGQDQ